MARSSMPKERRMELDEARRRIVAALEEKKVFGTMNSLMDAVNDQKGREAAVLTPRVATRVVQALREEGYLIKSRHPIKKNPKYVPPTEQPGDRKKGRK